MEDSPDSPPLLILLCHGLCTWFLYVIRESSRFPTKKKAAHLITIIIIVLKPLLCWNHCCVETIIAIIAKTKYRELLLGVSNCNTPFWNINVWWALQGGEYGRCVRVLDVFGKVSPHKYAPRERESSLSLHQIYWRFLTCRPFSNLLQGSARIMKRMSCAEAWIVKLRREAIHGHCMWAYPFSFLQVQQSREASWATKMR